MSRRRAMIVKNINDMEKQSISAHGGEGRINFCRVFREKEFESNWNFVDFVSIPPNSSIGIHRHEGNEEMYFILEGRGVMTVNNEKREVKAGDLILNKSGYSHGLRNEYDQDIKILVVEVKIEKD